MPVVSLICGLRNTGRRKRVRVLRYHPMLKLCLTGSDEAEALIGPAPERVDPPGETPQPVLFPKHNKLAAVNIFSWWW